MAQKSLLSEFEKNHYFILDEVNNIVNVSMSEYLDHMTETRRKEEEAFEKGGEKAMRAVRGRFVKWIKLGDVTVSTVFVGINMNIGSTIEVFESQAYSNNEWELEMNRYGTYEDAVAGHSSMVEHILDKRFRYLITKGLHIPKKEEVDYE